MDPESKTLKVSKIVLHDITTTLTVVVKSRYAIFQTL